MTLEDLIQVKAEVKRFNKRLDLAIARFKTDEYAKWGCKESGAVKRSAMDLKMELHNITK